MELLNKWKLQRSYLNQMEPRKKTAEAEAAKRSEEVIEEMFPEREEYLKMEALHKKTDAELRVAVANGELRFEGATTATRKDAEVNVEEAVKWFFRERLYEAYVMAREDDIDRFEEFLDFIFNDKWFPWLTLSKQGVKTIEDAVKNRTFEVPSNVAEYKEKVSAVLSESKILNPKVEE